MSEEGQEKQQRKTGRAMGGIDRQRSPYATLGGRHSDTDQPTIQPSERSDAQAASSSETPTANHSDAQLSNEPDAQPFSKLDTQPANRLDALASKRPERKKRTVYLEADIDRWIRHRIADTEQEISEVINEAVRLLMER